MIFDKAKDIDHRTIGGEAFIIAGAESHIHSLNDVGTFVFDACDGKTPVASIIDRVVEEFEVEAKVAEADVMEFVLQMEARGMLCRAKA